MKPNAIHPLEKWESLFTDLILSRGADYCRKGVVQNLTQSDSAIHADVAGTETIAQCLQVKGLLGFNDYENLLGDSRAKYIDFYYRYPDYFDLEKPDNVMMKYLSTSWFCIPGIALKDDEAKEAVEPRPYETFVPLKTGDELVVFTNPHEAVSYMTQNGLPVADYYFDVPYWHLLTIMDEMKVDELLLMPLCLNKQIPRQYIERTRRRKEY